MRNTKSLFFVAAFCVSTVLSVAQPMDSLDIKIGQMILIGVPGTTVDNLTLKEIKDGKAGSIIFFEKNIASKDSYAQFKKLAWAYQSVAPIPIFISIDQEGGRVNRLKEKYGFPRSITAAAMSASIDSVRYYGQTTATTLAGLGINVNFAPVVDVAIDPANPVIVKTERSFSSNEDSVSLYAREFIKAHRQVKVITVLKHFPGHGSSKADTHFGIADVTKTWQEKELTPYRSLIESGYVDAIMTAHIVNKNLDNKGLPGTLSRRMIDSLLRKQLHFDGVVFSDDMQMHAITKHFGLEEAIKLAVNAGVDILTFSNNIEGSETRTVERVHTIIKGFVKDGTIPKERIDESYARIMKLKSRLGQSEAEFYRNELLESEQQVRMLQDSLQKLNKQLRKPVPQTKPTAGEDVKKRKKKKN
ncbi:MAG: glycoside hydrolase family 3 protein [Cyclobacteriaceae bacterium]|nr:glycoside hydrolase family 3 protein [Cyclobacteriaceae bacterium]